ncbi:VanZ family protein [Clostridium sp. A1-XYC3]|uniref:VanZ family protein n=1 Tax=Clostridium tanneri TaxID=3037988 RepID=A0ABU4JYG7_9CLOT|nr:VanZ family protein [Clostridium sp. A1-XYC3]MDW8803165.1 VanZ family protein [Clostridium sp. A1-XYC3]
MRKYFKIILVFVWMAIIFIFSNQPAVVSDEKSRLVIRVFQFLGLNLDSILGELANFIIRKIAHFLEYLILYLLLFNALSKGISLKKKLILALFIVFLYACTDEFHQLFVSGRTGRIRDVIIDTFGGGAGALILYFKSK